MTPELLELLRWIEKPEPDGNFSDLPHIVWNVETGRTVGDIVRDAIRGAGKRLDAATVNFDKLHEYVGFADDLELDFGFNEKELLTKRRKIWKLNRENAAWKFRTVREGYVLKIFKFAL